MTMANSGQPTEDLAVAAATASASAPKAWQAAWRRFRQRKVAVAALCFLLAVVAVAIASIWFAPHPPNAQNVAWVNLPMRWPGMGLSGLDGTAIGFDGVRVDRYDAAGVPPDVHFLLGTDGLGRDLLSRLLTGMRISLVIAVVAALLDLTIGVSYGLVAGLGPAWLDSLMQRLIEILAGVPTLVVVVLMLTVFDPGMTSIILALVVTGWISMARLVRAQTLALREREFVLAARLLGAGRLRIAWRHVLPHTTGVVAVQAMFTIPTAIFFEAFLSFIGLGLRAPTASLGTLLSDGMDTFTFLPHQMLVPATALSLVMIAFNLVADGLRDAFDPRGQV